MQPFRTKKSLPVIRPSRSAITLLELLIGVAVSGLLVVSLGSALMIATRSIRPEESSAVTLDAARSLRMLQEDLRFATRVIDRTSGSIRILTTDANKDGSSDVVNYSWTGIAGSDLFRSVNGATATSVCPSVTDFNIAMATRGETQWIPAPPVPGSAVLLDDQTSSTGLDWESVGYFDAYGQVIRPSTFHSTTLTANDEWQITRVEYFALKTGWTSGSSYRFEMDKATTDGLPTHESLFTATLDPNEMSLAGSWKVISMTGLPWLDADQGVSMNFTYQSGTNLLLLPIARASTLQGFTATDESSPEWLRPALGRSLMFRIYGRIRTKTHLDQQEPARRFQLADLRLAATSVSDGPLYASAEFLNRPLDASFLANTDFSAFSIADDSNYDGAADWSLLTNGTTNSSSVASGKWTATNRSIRLTPTIAAGQQVDVRVISRDTTTASGSVLIRAAVAAANGGTNISALAYLTLQTNGTQTLAIYEETATNTFALLDQYTMLDSTLQEIRLVLNPQNQSVAIWVNQVFQESLSLGSITSPSLPSTVQIQAADNSCEFDFCSVITRSITTSEVVLP